VFVDEQVLEKWMRVEDFYSQVEGIGMDYEYEEFPGSSGCKKGPFDPECK